MKPKNVALNRLKQKGFLQQQKKKPKQKQKGLKSEIHSKTHSLQPIISLSVSVSH